MSDLATTVASMGKWIECLHSRDTVWDTEYNKRVDCLDCHGAGRFWEYALGEQVRMKCEPCYGTGFMGYTKDFPCKICGGLGWTASNKLENWFEEGRDYDLELVRGSNAYDHQLEHKRWVGRAISVHKFRRIEVGSDNVQEAVLSALREALQSEGYTVHLDVEKIKERHDPV